MSNAVFHPPLPINEPVRSYAPGRPERASLQKRLSEMREETVNIPAVIGGERVETGNTSKVVAPHEHRRVLAIEHKGGEAEVNRAIEAALDARHDWMRMDWNDRAAVFLRAADLLAGPWRDTLNAATMLGQSKNAFQAEIDAAAELIDFFRYNVHFMRQIYEDQPFSPPGQWNQVEYRGLEGFVFAVTPFNFTSIAGNLPTAPALMGNTVLWKPATTALLSAHYIMELLEAAGLPPGVINMVPGSGADVGDPALASEHLTGLHFTGSTGTFNHLWRTIGNNLDTYRTYPRIVGETGGKDFIVAHESADPAAVATAIVRGSFEYQGQKCSASSRIYVPQQLWPAVEESLLSQLAELRMGPVEDFSNFINAVIDQKSFDNLKGYIDRARDADGVEIMHGGTCDDADGYFIEPTVLRVRTRTTRRWRKSCSGPSPLRLRRAGVHELQRSPHARRPDEPVRAHRRRLRPRPRRHRRGPRHAGRGCRQLLHQRQADRRRRRAAAVRRRARLGHERQGRLDGEPPPLDEPPRHQGDVRPGDPLRLPVPRPRVEHERAGGARNREVELRSRGRGAPARRVHTSIPPHLHT
jgi:1-pyrroline-5-carboxylate dehydrogenase